MSFANDPTAVKALLEQLRASQAWQEAIAQQPSELETPTITDSSPSVASLLSQLQPSSSWSTPPPAPYQSSHDETHTHQDKDASSSTAYQFGHLSQENGPGSLHSDLQSHAGDTTKLGLRRLSSTSQNSDLKSYTFQQALPILAQLSQDPSFVDALTKLKMEQDDLERKLWDERTAIQIKYEEKVKVARTKATMIGGGLSKHEADMILTAYKRELQKFDLERVLPAWDGLIANQQGALAHLGVPTMFSTSAKPTRERQQRVVQVIEGIVNPSDP